MADLAASDHQPRDESPLTVIFLIGKNRDVLVGQAVSAPIRARALAALLETGEIERITFLHLEFVGPGRVSMIAAVDLTGDEPETRVAERVARIERRIEDHELVERALLTLSTPGAPAIERDRPSRPTGGVA